MRDRNRAFIVLAGVFVLGCLLGAAGSHFWFDKYAAQTQPVRRDDGQPPPHGRFHEPEYLELTPDQQKLFGDIMQESRQKLDALRMEQRPKIEAVLDEANRKILSMLTEKQQKKFQEFLKEINTWRDRESRGGRFGPPLHPSRNMPANPGGRPFPAPNEEHPIRPDGIPHNQSAA